MMKKLLLLSGLVLASLPQFISAADYPLDFKTLTVQQAMSLPSISSIYCMAATNRPPGLVKEPPAVSKRPLYGTINLGSQSMIFRLDESKGSRRGYDRLIVDVNQHGDLTGDPVVKRADNPAATGGVSGSISLDEGQFGPIQSPESKKIGADRPIYFAETIVEDMANEGDTTSPVRSSPSC